MHKHECAYMCVGAQRCAGGLVCEYRWKSEDNLEATPTLLFEIGSFIGLGFAKYVVSIA